MANQVPTFWTVDRIAAIVTIGGLMVAGILYLDNLRKQTEMLHAELLAASQDEQRRDAKWMQDETADFKDIHGRIDKLEAEHRDIRDAVTTSLDDLNYRLGVHAGDHGCKNE